MPRVNTISELEYRVGNRVYSSRYGNGIIDIVHHNSPNYFVLFDDRSKNWVYEEDLIPARLIIGDVSLDRFRGLTKYKCYFDEAAGIDFDEAAGIDFDEAAGIDETFYTTWRQRLQLANWEYAPVPPLIINKNTMLLKKYIKNKELKEDEKLFRKYGMKDEKGNYTQEYKDIANDRMLKDSEAYVLATIKEKEVEDELIK